MPPSVAVAKPDSLDSFGRPLDRPPFVQDTLYTVDDLVRSRAKHYPDVPILAYPSSDSSLLDYSHYTTADLSRFADEAAYAYLRAGIQNIAPISTSTPPVVAMLAPSDMDYIVTMVGLVRLGYTVLMLSNRLPANAIDSLLTATKAELVVHASAFVPVLKEVAALRPDGLKTIDIISRKDWDPAVPSPSSDWPLRGPADALKNCFIIHSSGSTGLPKPIFQTHQAAINNYASSFEMKGFITLPLYHNHGISSFFRAVYANKEITFYNGKLPLTGSNLTKVMQLAKPEVFYGVPYALKLLAESKAGIECLANCNLVLYGGSSCPDELGDRLVDAGVYLCGHYGSTETGQLLTSLRPKGDKAWNYLRLNGPVKDYVLMDEISPDVYECVCLDGWKSKVVSNSDNPPNSFRTKDLFSRHPTIPDAYKYLGRVDDRVTLMNGEKVLPIPIEHRIRQDIHVQECIVVGVERSAPALFIIPSDATVSMTEEQVIDAVWPAIADANAHAEAFSQITRELVRVLPYNVEYPHTDKGTIIRAGFYKAFAADIDALYSSFEGGEGTLALSVPELEKYLFELFTESLHVNLEDASSDFYSFGADSLQAIRVWSILKRTLDLGGKADQMSQNIVFETANCKALARYLYSLRTGEQVAEDDDVAAMQELYEKYSVFTPHVAGTSVPDGEYVIITGTTGSLGAHALAQALRLPNVKKVYCLVRAASDKDARARVISSLTSREIVVSDDDLNKMEAYPSDFSLANLGLADAVIEELRSKLTTVIHSAWAVNFNIGVRSFEKYHINGVHNMIQLCLDTTTAAPAKFYFCSSISVAAGTPLPAVIHEAPIDKFEHAQNMGYARSKLVTEHIVETAGKVYGAHARVFRIGQIVGDSVNGNWNDTEAIPLMIRSAITLHALPRLDETPAWLPVDCVARSMLELSGVLNDGVPPEDSPDVVYHINNPYTFRWTEDLLPALKRAGLQFKEVSQREWVRLLREEGDQDPVRNPTVKLLGFFEEKYDNDKPGRKGLVLETQVTAEKSEALKNAPEPVGSGLIDLFVKKWLEKWV
ncbi:hypothetical protein BZA70DRAFT_280239 [Myxozyma melibiosi]|uniref:Carrier domain-containing protein n=1 Tax=Myxozyma melibiosi TaxID=54550 RepID=A0ABR1F4X2_9ASCO